MVIRQAQKEDLPKILEMNEAAVPHVSSVKMAEMKKFLKWANPFLVIEIEKELAGFMIVLQKGLDYQSMNYRFFCGNYKNFDYVDRIVIHEDFRGQKLGSALYEYLFKHSERKRVACEVNLKPANPDSMSFHTAMGFSKVAEQHTDGGNKSVAMLIKRL